MNDTIHSVFLPEKPFNTSAAANSDRSLAPLAPGAIRTANPFSHWPAAAAAASLRSMLASTSSHARPTASCVVSAWGRLSFVMPGR